MAAAVRTGAFTSGGTILACNNGSQPQLGFQNGTNTVAIWCGSNLTGTATDGTWHFMQGVCNSTSGTLDVNTTQTTGNTNTSTLAGALALGSLGGGGTYLTGDVGEAGILANTYQSALVANVRNYWNF